MLIRWNVESGKWKVNFYFTNKQLILRLWCDIGWIGRSVGILFVNDSIQFEYQCRLKVDEGPESERKGKFYVAHGKKGVKHKNSWEKRFPLLNMSFI